MGIVLTGVEPGRQSVGRLLAAAALLGLLWFFQAHPLVVEALAPLSLATAWATQWSLDALGLHVARAGTILAHPGGFSYRIDPACTALAPAGLLAAMLWVLRARVIVLIGAVFLMTLLNQVRLASLMWVGVRMPADFDAVHELVWPSLLSIIGVAFLLVWRRASSR